ncbi:MAG: biotin transporter BioY [Pseudomonadota bacterium]
MNPINSFGDWASGSIGKNALLVGGGVALLFGMSQVAIGGPVPMTLQTLAVMLIGLTFGFRLSVATVGTYLAIGAAGAPVFAKFAGGAHHFVGGTGGFLVGFLVCAAIIGFAVDRGITKGWVGTFAALLTGITVVFALGYAWLAHLIGPEKAWQFGVAPFILGDAIKVVLAALIGKGVIKGAGDLAKL